MKDSAQTVASVCDTGAPARVRYVGTSDVAQGAERLLQAVAARECHVLITGESGTGKELAAREVHQQSKRAAHPFVPVDCTTLNAQLFESQLFGHTKGAFTGADRETLGFFRAADGGTLFLDEIGELDLPLQAKLLRSIQERAVVPLGTSKAIAVNVRIVAATNRDLRQMVADGKFREDLFYRLNVVNVSLPSLKQRKDDVPALAEFLAQRVAELYEEPVKELSTDTVEALREYDWPGNIRELANAIEHAYVMSGSELLIGVHHLPDYVQPERLYRDPHEMGCSPQSLTQISPLTTGGPMTLDEMLRWLLTEALKAAKGNQTAAARSLGIHRQRFYRLVERYHLQVPTAQ